MKETIGFIGLGGMGLAMATNLLKVGFGLRVFNRTAEKARPLLELGAHLAEELGDGVGGQPAGDVSGPVPAHAIRDDEQVVLRENGVAVLVVVALQAYVRQT